MCYLLFVNDEPIAIDGREMRPGELSGYRVLLDGVAVEAVSADESTGLVEMFRTVAGPYGPKHVPVRKIVNGEQLVYQLKVGESSFNGMVTYYAHGFVQIEKPQK